MTLSLSEKTLPAKLGIIAGLLLAAVVVALWMASYFFLWRIKQPPATAMPWTVLQYWHYYGSNPNVTKWVLISLAFGAVSALIPMAMVFMPAKKSLHGDARFANEREIKEAGLFGDTGIILGRWGWWKSRFLMLSGQLGALCAAPPRSGKGAGLVQPNMYNFPDSVVLSDIRKESWRLTAGFRAAHGQEVFLFDPLSETGRTAQWNPFTYVSDDPVLRVNDIMKIANMLSPDPAHGDPFWPASCRTLFLGLALYLFETPGLPRTFGQLVRLIMTGEGETIGDHWKKVIETRDADGTPLSEICKASLYDFIFVSGNTQSSIRKTFTAKLELWLNPLVDAATSGNSFDFNDLRRRRMTIYIGIAPADLDRLSLLVSLFYQQLVDENTREMPEDNPDLKYQCLMLMDEFTAMGRVSIFATAMSFLGGYNLRPFIIIHGPSQLRDVYGADVAETIMTCMGAQVVYTPKEQRQADEISKSLGTFTVKVTSQSRPSFFSGRGNSSGSTSTSQQPRDLMKPQEVRELGPTKEIIFLENCKPIKASKIRYYKEQIFKSRLMPPPVVPPINLVVKYAPIKAPAPSISKPLEITPENIDVLDKLDLSNFSCNFDAVNLEQSVSATPAEIDAAIDELFATLDDEV